MRKPPRTLDKSGGSALAKGFVMTSIRETPVRGNTATQGLRALADAVTIWNNVPAIWWKTADDAQAFADVLSCPRLSREWTDHAVLYDDEFTPAMHNRDARLIVAHLLQRRINDGDLGDILGRGRTS